jgi:hypothetical protein
MIAPSSVELWRMCAYGWRESSPRPSSELWNSLFAGRSRPASSGPPKKDAARAKSPAATVERVLVAQAIVEPATLYTTDQQLVPFSDLVRRIGAG